MSAAPSVEQSGLKPKSELPEERIAVIAVHGVGHAEPGGTVRHIADLLLGLGRFQLAPPERRPGQPPPLPVPWGPKHPPYSGFRTQPIQVALKAAPLSHPEKAVQRTVEVVASNAVPGGKAQSNVSGTGQQTGTPMKAEPTAWQNFVFYLDERRGYVAEVFASKKAPDDLKQKLEDHAFLGHEFMRAQLAGYVSEPEGQTYDTIRLETERNDGKKKSIVHLYEAYWADLARPQNSIWSFFLAFYQLLLHLGSLSRTAVDYATVEHYEYRSWRWHAFWQGWAVRFLVLPITILNLYLVLAGLSGLPLILPWDRCWLAGFGMATLALGGLLLWPRVADAPRSPFFWISLLIFVFVGGGAVGYGLAWIGRPDVVLALEWWLLGFGLIYAFVLVPYDKVRRGAARVGSVFYGCSLLAFLYCLVQAACRGYSSPVDQAGLWTMQILMFALTLSWLGMLFSALAAYVLHFVCLWVLPDDEEATEKRATKVRARAALRTGRLTLAASASMFLVVTVFLWSGIYKTTRERLHLHGQVQLVPVPLSSWRAGLFNWVVPTANDAIRWGHQPKSPAPSDEERLTRLEHWDWEAQEVCKREAPKPGCCRGDNPSDAEDKSQPDLTLDEDLRLQQLETKAHLPAADADLIPLEADLSQEAAARLRQLDRIYRLERYARLRRLEQWNWQSLPGCKATAQPSVLGWPPPPARGHWWSREESQPYEKNKDVSRRLLELEGTATRGLNTCKKENGDKNCPRKPRIDLRRDASGPDRLERDGSGGYQLALDDESRLYRLELLAQPNSEPALDTYADTLMLVSATAGLHLLLIAFTIALGLLVWAVVPCLLVDTYALADPKKFNNCFSRSLGNWYSRGLDSTRNITWLLWHSIFTMALVLGALDFLYSHGWLDPASQSWIIAKLGELMRASTGDALHVLDVVGAGLAISGAVIGAFLYQKGRVVLDIILDVDHYLRTSPLESAPRARIAERYTSLLRYIASEKGEDDTPYYTSVVIAAHSLGALISADLLQYLQRECDNQKVSEPELRPLGFGEPLKDKDGQLIPPIPISLFTFGNPIRQLLNRFFPHLYWWVRDEPDNAIHALSNAADLLHTPGQEYAIPNDATPNPRKHNLKRWVSAYRSGDFVGRSLWLNGWFARTEKGDGEYVAPPDRPAKAKSKDGLREEFCIGAGGHNNYWDRSAPDMAHALDEIIGS